ncbi:hypothetical protein BDK51DRAFT_41166, partial [Blyttiomyces helicus]
MRARLSCSSTIEGDECAEEFLSALASGGPELDPPYSDRDVHPPKPPPVTFPKRPHSNPRAVHPATDDPVPVRDHAPAPGPISNAATTSPSQSFHTSTSSLDPPRPLPQLTTDPAAAASSSSLRRATRLVPIGVDRGAEGDNAAAEDVDSESSGSGAEGERRHGHLLKPPPPFPNRAFPPVPLRVDAPSTTALSAIRSTINRSFSDLKRLLTDAFIVRGREDPKFEVLRVGIVTWNMNGRLPTADLVPLLGDSTRPAPFAGCHLLAIGTQECLASIERSMLFRSKEEWEKRLVECVGDRYILVRAETLVAVHLAVFVLKGFEHCVE